MNRVAIGFIALLVFVGIIFLGYRAVSSLSRIMRQPVQTTGKLGPSDGTSALPSATPFLSPSLQPQPSVVGSNTFSPMPQATVSASPIISPSPSYQTPKTGGQLPATGL